MLKQQLVSVRMIYPKFEAAFWSFQEAVNLLDLKATMPPTGLATVAAMLPTKRFNALPIIDLRVDELTDDAFLDVDLVMVSAMIAQKESLRAVIAQAKGLGKKVAVGGPYPTSYREDVLAMGADYLVLNEAEQTLSTFVEDFLAGKAETVYDEHSVASRSKISLTKEGKPLITSTPTPRWDLLKLSMYSSLAIQFSRGCPFNCEFCDITNLFGHQSRTKNNEQMLAELDAILATGWRGSIFLVDDNFIGNRTRVREFLPALIAWQKQHGYPFSFYTEASVDLANENLRDTREMMVIAGFKEVFCGIESTNLDVLAEMNKGQNRGDLSEKVRILQEAGFEVTAGFIAGNDADTITVFDDLKKFIQDNGIVMAMPGLLTALKGTGLYRRLVAENRLRVESSGNNTHQFQLNFDPKLDETFLIEGYINLLEQLFSPKNYYDRCRTLRRRRGKLPKCGHINGSWFKATLRVFYRNLIKKPNWAFAKFMFGTMLTVPLDMPQAVTQAVKFEHFKKITGAAVSAHRYHQRVETLLERFQKRMARLQGDLNLRLQKSAALERKFVAKAVKRYHKLDPDFLRANAKQALTRLRDRIRAYAEAHRQTWQNI